MLGSDDEADTPPRREAARNACAALPMTPVSYIQQSMPRRTRVGYGTGPVADDVFQHAADCAAIAERLTRARADRVALAAFPGRQPQDLATAYRIQDAAITRWPDRIVGWKVGGVPPDQQAQLGATRLMGPIFASRLQRAEAGAESVFPIFPGGFAAVEAEIVFRIGVDRPRLPDAATPAAVLACVDAVHAGVETAGSPMAAINRLGATAVVSDFGNNHGLILGPELDLLRAPDRATGCYTVIDGSVVGRELLQDGLFGPALSLAFAIDLATRRGWPLRRGDYITTGALTGIHDIVDGQRAEIGFDGCAPIVCRAAAGTAARPTGDSA
jgi:2-keto-4-pentenoate hydratase